MSSLEQSDNEFDKINRNLFQQHWKKKHNNKYNAYFYNKNINEPPEPNKENFKQSVLGFLIITVILPGKNRSFKTDMLRGKEDLNLDHSVLILKYILL